MSGHHVACDYALGGELEQPIPLAPGSHDPKLVDDGLAAVEYRRSVGPLVGVDR